MFVCPRLQESEGSCLNQLFARERLLYKIIYVGIQGDILLLK